VKAFWQDGAMATRKFVEVGGGEGPAKELRKTYASAEAARKAATAELEDGNAAVDRIEVTMAGAPWLRAEDPFVLPPLEPEYAGDWVIQQIVHTMMKDGFRSRASLERPRQAGA